ncbi:MAG: hypothetical protein AAF732_02465 [Pseudomonadota bacterium]
MRVSIVLGCVSIVSGLAAMPVDTKSNIELQSGKALALRDFLDPGLRTSLTAAVVVVALSIAATQYAKSKSQGFAPLEFQ